MILLVVIVSLIESSNKLKRKIATSELSSKVMRYDTGLTCLKGHENDLELATELEDDLILDQYLLSEDGNNLEDIFNEISSEIATNEDCIDVLNDFIEKELDNFVKENIPNDCIINLDDEEDTENDIAKICEEQPVIISDDNNNLLSNHDISCAEKGTTIIVDESDAEEGKTIALCATVEGATIALDATGEGTTIVLDESDVEDTRITFNGSKAQDNTISVNGTGAENSTINLNGTDADVDTTITLYAADVDTTISLDKSNAEGTISVNESGKEIERAKLTNEHKNACNISNTSNITQNALQKQPKKVLRRFDQMCDENPLSAVPLSHEYVSKYSKAIFKKILSIISKCADTEHFSLYLTKLKDIKYNIRLIRSSHDTSLDIVQFITPEHESMCKSIITDLNANYKIMNTPDNKTLKLFSLELEKHLKSSKIYYTLHNDFTLLDPYKRTHLMYAEFIKLYDYLEEIPELIIIGTILPSFYSEEIMNFLLLINMLVKENSKRLGEIRKFMLLFIMTALKSSKMSTLYTLSDTEFQTGCTLKHTSIICLLLGAPEEALLRVECKIQNGKLSDWRLHDVEKYHCKIGLLLILYQHFLFLKYHNLNVEEVKLTREFIDKVIAHDSCSLCLFQDFLRLIAKQIK